MIRSCHRIREEKFQKNHCQHHFVARSTLNKRWKFQPDSSNGMPVRSCKGCCANPYPILRQLKMKKTRTRLMVILRFYLFQSIVLRVGCRYFLCTVSHPGISSSTLQHSFDISVAGWAAGNLLAANWVGFAHQPLHDQTITGVLFKAIGLKFSAFVKNRLGYKMT